MGRSTASKALKYLIPHNAERRARMTELMKQDEVDKARVARVEERKTKFQEEKAAARASHPSASEVEGSQESPHVSSAPFRLDAHVNDPRAAASSEGVKADEEVQDLVDTEVETEVALSMSQTSREEFAGFLNNIQVGFANAVHEDIDIAEVYSAPRAAKACEKFGLKVGWSLDICTKDEDGRPWDFTQVEMRNRAARKLIENKPLLLIGSPPCTEWSIPMNLNWDKMDPDIVAERNA